jgi:hypothetical protein
VNDAGVDGADPARPASRWAAFECRSGVCSHGRCFRHTRWIPVEWVSLHSLWAVGLGLVCPGRGSSASFRHRLPRLQLRSLVLGWRGRYHSWFRDQGEVSLCVLLTHSMVMTRAAVGRVVHIERLLLRSRAPHRLMASAGGCMGCLRIRCVVCGSEPLSHPRGVPIQLLGLRDAHGIERPVVCQAGATYGTCVPLCPPSLSDLQNFTPHQNPRRSCAAAAVVGQPPHPLAHEKSAAESVVKPRGERCWRGRYRSCPTSLSLCSIRIPIWGLLARALLPPYAVDTR